MKTADDVMKKVMEYNLSCVQRSMKDLECLVYELDNTMNECCCDNRKVFDFRNISTEEMHVFCISCGGYIEPKDLEDCGIF